MVTEPIGEQDTAGDLLARLAESGASLLVATLDGIEAGQLEPRPQPADGVSYRAQADHATTRGCAGAPPRTAVGRQIRACTPAPGAWTMLGDTRLKLVAGAAMPPPDAGGGPRAAVAGPLAPGRAVGRAGGCVRRDRQPPGRAG